MDDAKAFVKEFLAHYSSQYYDPQKAHEYYLRTRELSERRSSSALKSKEKKEAWAYAKDQISGAQKKELTEAQKNKDNVVAQMRSQAVSRRKELSDKLSLVLKSLSKDRTEDSDKITEEHKVAMERIAEAQRAEAKRISEKASREIASLPPIPKGISDERRAKLSAERKDKIAKIRGEASNDRDALNAKAKSQREAVSADTSAKRQASSKKNAASREDERAGIDEKKKVLADGMKESIDKARTDFAAFKERVKAKYEQRSQQEYEAIKQKV